MGKGGNRKGKQGGKQTSSGGAGGNEHKSSKHVYASKRPVGGKGVFVTCVRGKESRAVGEMYDLLEEVSSDSVQVSLVEKELTTTQSIVQVADRLYPKERVDKMMEARQKMIEERAKAKLAETSNEQGEGAQKAAMDQDQDAEKAGDGEEKPLASPAPVVVDDSDDDDDDLDIEASIQKELAALKSGRGGSQTKVKQDNGKGKAKERPRFQNIETGTECREFHLSFLFMCIVAESNPLSLSLVCFIAIAWPYDPVELVEALVSEVQETGQSRTR